MLYLEGMERVELHFHLLPGVDDGPPDLATALELARAAVRDGTRLVTSDPHAAFVDVAEIPAGVSKLQAALDRAQIALEVRAGAELSWYDVPELGEAELEIVAQGPHRTGAGCCSRRRCRGPGTLEELTASAQELRDRGFGLRADRPPRALAGAPSRRPAPSRDCSRRVTACSSTAPRSPATTAPVRGPRRSLSPTPGARPWWPPTCIAPASVCRA